MKYDREIVMKADEEISKRRQTAQEQCAARKNNAANKDPRFAEIDAEMAEAASRMTYGVLNKEGSRAVEKAKIVITNLQQEREALLKKHMLPANTYVIEYSCANCLDTGVDPNGGPCSCYIEALRSQAFKSSFLATALAGQTFENFDLTRYSDKDDKSGISPYKRMKINLQICRDFAVDFDSQEKSLILLGPTGVGKTHLSSAIARELAASGYSVQYDMAANIFRRLEDRRFGRLTDLDPDIYLTCDLLVMDDLGSEFGTPLTMAELFTLINTRLITNRRTVISSNYSMKELSENYTQKLTSRFLGGYTILQFTGEDARTPKK